MPRVGRRKPIDGKENPVKKVNGVSQLLSQTRRTIGDASMKLGLTDSVSIKPKIAENTQAMQAMALPQSSNLKSFAIQAPKLQANNKTRDGNQEEAKETRKKRIELVTTSFLIGYNQMRDLVGLTKSIDAVMFDAFDRLQWLDLQHNYLTTVSEEIGQFKNLKTLYLHANYIPSIREFANIKGLTNLRNLTVHGNPLVRIPHFRLYFVAVFPGLKKLDTVLISKKERDNARVLVEEFKVKSLPVYAESDVPLPPAQKELTQASDD
jgi:hypothetical protein